MSTRTMRLLLFSVLTLISGYSKAMADVSRFACGGSVEAEAWDLWDRSGRGFVQDNLLQDRLLKHGDVYALYDFQAFAQNMVSMARRCNRIDRIREVAGQIRIAYGVLETGSLFSSGRRWICRGGRICSIKNRMLNQEVMLCSVQFLAIASSVANALASSPKPLSDEDKKFVRDTTEIVAEHLLRWADDDMLTDIRKATEAKPEDVKSGSSKLFFTDKSLWLITIYAELAGILNEGERKSLRLRKIDAESTERLDQHLKALLGFFSARISYQRSENSRGGGADRADLDRGFWRLFSDNRYAGYEKEEKPVACVDSDKGRASEMEVRVHASSVPKRQDIGWDISHTRRVVVALDALERNREQMKNIFSLSDARMPPRNLASAFANTLADVVWNGDRKEPLFSNYWSGANGWYRVAWEGATGKCREGYPPYGLSDSFLTGGYITWARYRPVIGLLGQRFYDLISSPGGESLPFIIKYYPTLSESVKPEQRERTKAIFLASLVGVSGK